ncbi:MAG TPA: hypothetical protein VGL63_17230 [Streptosporangiaceae bacterium]|jgi:hypothetical protein
MSGRIAASQARIRGTIGVHGVISSPTGISVIWICCTTQAARAEG